ncbi:MAG: DNA-binding protein [Clostridia bacterium]|jgi:DNA-binding protein HU-beta|nr:DNA-binding protein [Clostridia bacterium]
MNKAELVSEVSDETGISKRTAKNILDAITKTITGTLSQSEKVTLIGFGTFQVRQRKERKGVNPQTKEALTIPAKKVLKFKAGKELREAVE